MAKALLTELGELLGEDVEGQSQQIDQFRAEADELEARANDRRQHADRLEADKDRRQELLDRIGKSNGAAKRK